MTLRAPRFAQYNTFWLLAVEGRTAEAEAWRKRNEQSLSLWDDIPMVFPGFYRTKKGAVPIAFWLEAPLDAAGDVMGAPYLVMKNGTGRAKIEKDLQVHGHYEFWMTWERCRQDAVTEAAYRYAVEHYDAATGTFPWADRRLKEPPPPRRDLRNSPSVF